MALADSLTYFFWAFPCAGIAGLVGWHWRNCYRKGTVYYRGWHHRAEQPIAFWLNMIMLGICAVVFLGCAVSFAGIAAGAWE